MCIFPLVYQNVKIIFIEHDLVRNIDFFRSVLSFMNITVVGQLFFWPIVQKFYDTSLDAVI